ncbi:MAG: AgmX/PglI C-terminal domain-containing protein [Bdellovibrionales bacterium]|nr:AgmX/PglI C-terminal domain-containing protein [Bdellovibrionales bacterium]
MEAKKIQFLRPIRVRVFEGSEVIFDRSFHDGPLFLGRGAQCEIPLIGFDFISRQHVSITIENDCIVVLDLNSTNGMTVGGQKTLKAMLNQDGEIRIGTLNIHLQTFAEENVQTQSFIKHVAGNDAPKAKPTANVFGNAPVLHAPIAQAGPSTAAPNSQPGQKPQSPMSGAKSPVTTGPAKSQPVAAPSIIYPQAPIVAQAPAGVGSGGALNAVTPAQYKPQSRDQAPMRIDWKNPHPLAAQLKPNSRVLEGFVTWADEIFDIQEFRPGEKVVAGTGFRAGLYVPQLKRNTNMAIYTGKETRCFIPPGCTGEITKVNGAKVSMSELISSQLLVKKNGGYVLKLGVDELLSVDLDGRTQLHFRYAPAPRQLTKRPVIEPDEEFKRTTFISGFIHFFVAALILLNMPDSKAPKVDNVPERFARLLVEPPKLMPIVEKKIEEKKIEVEKIKEEVKKQEIVKKVQPQPKKIVMKKPIPDKRVPIKANANAQVKATPVEMKQPEVNVQTVGALAALSSLPTSTPTNIPSSININKNAGGKEGPTTSNVISALSSVGGKLPPGGGMGNVKTKGLGYGSGTGFGTAGLAGKAGNRGVAGAVVGRPKLVQVKADEGLTNAQVMAIVKQYLGEIQQCYERSLLDNPGIAGRVEYEWEIESQGRVQEVRVKKSEIASADQLNTCVMAVFKRMKFPVAKNGHSTTPNIGFPFGRL